MVPAIQAVTGRQALRGPITPHAFADRHSWIDMTETIQHPDGRVDLTPEAHNELRSSPMFNEDLAPVPVAKRNWTTYNYAALWISMAHCIPTYMMASGLI